MRDFREFLPASFRGVPFHVDKDNDESGRYVATHEYVRAETFDTEDMGIKAPTFSVTGYVASDAVEIESAALRSAGNTPGTGLLILPGIPPALCRCTKIKRAREKDRMGLVAFDMEFAAAGGEGAFVTTLFDLATASAAGALASLVRPALQAIRR